MDNQNNLVLVEQFCTFHKVNFSFVKELKDYGLLQIVIENGQEYIEEEKLSDLEKMVRLHYDLEINMEGIQAIHHLLNKIENLQSELTLLHNRLGRYDTSL